MSSESPVHPEASPLQPAFPTLGEVIRSLQGEVVRVALIGAESGARVVDVAILDATDPHSIPAGGIVLGVGLSVSGGDAIAAVDRAGRAGAAALVFRTEEEVPGRLLEIAESSDVAVLTVAPEVTWGQLYSLLRTAIASAGAAHEADALGVRVGDLFALADAIAAAVGGPVTIEDPHWRVLAYSNLDQPIDEARRQTILGRLPPAAWQERLEDAGVARAMRSGEAIVRFEAEGLATRTVAPIRAGSELLGAIWVAEGESPLDGEGERELAHLAQLAAIHLLAHRASEDVKRRTRGAFVRELLDGRVPVTSNGTVAALKVDGPFTVLAFEFAEDGGPPPTSPERILSIVSLYCEAEHRDAMCAFVADRFWAVVPTPRSRARLLELARNIVERVDRALHVRLRAGIGASVPRAGEVPRSRRSAEQALKIGARRPDSGPVVDIDDVRTHAVLLELLDVAADRPALLQGRLAELVRHDAEHNTEYVPTLRAYLDAWGDITAAGGRLGLHPNTVRYRVRRMAEISGIDLSDPDERLVLELQLRLHEEQARG